MPSCYACRLGGAGSQESDSSQTAKKDMLAALRARQEALEETLRQRLEELKSICIREAVRVVDGAPAQVKIGPFPFRTFKHSPRVVSLAGADRKAPEGISAGPRRGAAHRAAKDRHGLQAGRAEDPSKGRGESSALTLYLVSRKVAFKATQRR